MTLIDILRDHAFTRGLGDAQLTILAAMATKVAFDEDQLVLEEGQRSQSFYLVLSGSVSVELRTATYAVSVQAVGPGQAFGWSALLEDHDTLFQVRTRERDHDMTIVCPCIPFHRAHFDAMRRCWCGLFVHQDVTDPDSLPQIAASELGIEE